MCHETFIERQQQKQRFIYSTLTTRLWTILNVTRIVDLIETL